MPTLTILPDDPQATPAGRSTPGMLLPPAEQAELADLIRAEVDAAGKRATSR